jgi:hypothetical protein
MSEPQQIERLLRTLNKQPKVPFPVPRARLLAPHTQGVYVIRNSRGRVMHVGRSHRGKKGLHQRLTDHLAGKSSFVGSYWERYRAVPKFRKGYTFQYLEVVDSRHRLLLEYLATVRLSPRHLLTGDGAA